MIKIKYPTDKTDIKDFHDLYIKLLSFPIDQVQLINKLLSKVIWNNAPLDLNTVLTARFDLLKEMNSLVFHHLTVSELMELYTYFDYNSRQQRIANFFMSQHWIAFDTCYYCNIDSVYSFSDTEEYMDPLQFTNRASEKELRLIEGVGSEKASEIIAKRIRAPFTRIEDVPVGNVVLKRIKALELKKSHNHFTIDHFFHKDGFDFLSLSLYNFVPSCYSCNSKFKKIKSVGTSTSTVLTSPSSDRFSINTDFSFKLLLTKKLENIKKLEDFTLSYEVASGNHAYTDFLKVFKIMGRYQYYKREALILIQKKVNYPETKITELAALLGKTNKEFRFDLFGREYFDSSYDQKSLVKFKRDIARDINILDVLD